MYFFDTEVSKEPELPKNTVVLPAIPTTYLSTAIPYGERAASHSHTGALESFVDKSCFVIMESMRVLGIKSIFS